MRIRNLLLLAVLFGFILCSLIQGCKDEGCEEGFREFNGECIPESSDNNQADGDSYRPPFPDGDGSVDGDDGSDGDGVEEDGDGPADVQSGAGSCGDPFIHSTDGIEETLSGRGLLTDLQNDVQASSCFPDSGQEDPIAPGKGKEVVVRIIAEAGDLFDVTFTSQYDGLIYVLVGSCSEASDCLAHIDNEPEGNTETLNLTLPIGGTYYFVFDARSESASGQYEYTIDKLPREEDGDDDGDAEDDSSDGDVPVDEIPIGTEQAIPIPDNGSFSDIFTDLGWKTGVSPQELVLVSDGGIASLSYDGTTFPDAATQNATESSYRGVAYESGLQPSYLDIDAWVITNNDATTIDLPPDFGENPSGLAYHNGDYLATEASANKLFRFRWNSSSSSWENTSMSFLNFNRLNGLAVASGRLFLLNSYEASSRIHEIDPATGEVLQTWILQGEKLAGIAFHPDSKSFWGVREQDRFLVRLSEFGDF